MPDLLTHLASAHIVRRSIEYSRENAWSGKESTLFYLGGILPDLLSKPATIVFPNPEVIWFVSAAHTPAAVLFLSYLIVMVLKTEGRIVAMRFILGGTLLHFGLDIMQKHLASGAYYWFFPFSWKTFNIPLFWPSDTILAIPFLVAGVFLLEVIQRYRRIAPPRRLA